jgi:hypothetical protein
MSTPKAAPSAAPVENLGKAVLSSSECNDEPNVPYSIYNRKEKWFIVAMVAVAGFFRHVDNSQYNRSSSTLTGHCCNSPLPANIYLPAIPKMAQEFNASIELLNQTVTAYLVMQGICELLGLRKIILVTTETGYLTNEQHQCSGVPYPTVTVDGLYFLPAWSS